MCNCPTHARFYETNSIYCFVYRYTDSLDACNLYLHEVCRYFFSCVRQMGIKQLGKLMFDNCRLTTRCQMEFALATPPRKKKRVWYGTNRELPVAVAVVYRMSMDISFQQPFFPPHLGADVHTCYAGPSEDGATEMKIMAKKGAGTDGILKKCRVCFVFRFSLYNYMRSSCDFKHIICICMFKLTWIDGPNWLWFNCFGLGLIGWWIPCQ